MIQHDEISGKFYSDGVEVTETEYFQILNDVNAKNQWADDIFTGSATIDDCPAEWREEVERMVAFRAEDADPEPGDADAVKILLGDVYA